MSETTPDSSQPETGPDSSQPEALPRRPKKYQILIAEEPRRQISELSSKEKGILLANLDLLQTRGRHPAARDFASGRSRYRIFGLPISGLPSGDLWVLFRELSEEELREQGRRGRGFLILALVPRTDETREPDRFGEILRAALG
jgi:hypothetical protein